MVAAAASPTDSASPDTIHTATNAQTYQEEMCEKLIQLSFVKIVSSKSERGGARLRKNLLILHLLQKARMEQRNRLFAAAAARSVASQRAEVTTPVVNTQPDAHVLIDHGHQVEVDGSDEEGEKIDTEESYSQQDNVEQHPQPTPGSITCRDEWQTSSSHAHADSIPRCDRPRYMRQDSISEPGCSDQTDSTCQSARAEEETEVGNNEQATWDTNSTPLDDNGNKLMNRRGSLKRKHDSQESSQNDWNSSSSTKMACVMRHRTASESSPNTPLNELLFFKTATPSSTDDENGGQGQTVAPVARSLSCSSFMELTCES